MSQKITAITDSRVSAEAKRVLDTIVKFVDEDCIPADPVFLAQVGWDGDRWGAYPKLIEDLKAKANNWGLWNLFLPNGHYAESPGFTNLEYALMTEYMGKSIIASEAMNCSPPDTGNMEVIARYGNPAQKKQWLEPLMNGEIRSAFLMTEPDIASSDARNIQLHMRKEGNKWVLNGSKWWSSGAGDSRCKIYVVVGKSSPNNKDAYKQQSVLLVPAGTPGITLKRMLSIYGYDDAPHGHAHIIFENVRVPDSAMVLGEGRGFEIMQGRLGPGRIHHCMRSIGVAEKALDWMLMRINDPKKAPFGKMLRGHGVIMEWVAKAHVEIDAARLLILNTAIKIDQGGAKSALKEIGESKVLVPQMALKVVDRAIQTLGTAGVSQDSPLASMGAMMRTLRIADGPDEAHLSQLGRNENKRGPAVAALVKTQAEESERLFS